MIPKLRSFASLLAITSAVTLTCVGAVGADPPPPTGYVPDGEPVEFETLGIVSDTTGINLGEHILRLGNDDDIEAAGRLLADGEDSPSVDAIVDSIGEIPAGTVVLIGIIDISCTPADEAGLVRGDDGELAMFAPGHVPEPIECFAANVSVAVLRVDADDAPPGSTDGAELVHFGHAGLDDPGHDVTAVELTDDPDALTTILPDDAEVPELPPVPEGVRRLAWLGVGCALATVELWVTPAVLYPHFELKDPHDEVLCEAAEYVLAVFDLPADEVPPDAELYGSSLG